MQAGTDILKTHDGEKVDEKKYRGLIGKLLFVANRSRPDVLFGVIALSQFSSDPTLYHWNMLLQILEYLYTTIEYHVNLSDADECNLIGFSDASWASYSVDRKSFSGHIFFLGNIPLCWKCTKQKCVALSTMEAEVIALSEAAKVAKWLKEILEEIKKWAYLK